MATSIGMELQAGRELGSYRLVLPLKQAERTELWVARPLGDGRAPVALKVLRADYENPLGNLLDGVRAAAALSHPAIVRPIDVKETSTSVYLASELVRGPSLATLTQRLALAGRPLAAAQLLHIGLAVTSALELGRRARAKGKAFPLLHGHLSPHNILIDREGGVHLTDLGIVATDVCEHPISKARLRGKPSYLAPEQIEGEELDASADVFSLAVVLVEAASLRSLFGRPTVRASIEAVVSHPPRPLPEVVPGFPLALWKVLARALSKDPAERFQNTEEFGEALERCAAEIPGKDAAPGLLARILASVLPPNCYEIAHVDLGTSSVTGKPLPEPEIVWPVTNAPDPLSPKVLQELSGGGPVGKERQASSSPPAASSSSPPEPAEPDVTSLPPISERPQLEGTGPTPFERLLDKAREVLEDPKKRNLAAIYGAATVVALLAVVALTQLGGEAPDAELRRLYESQDYAAAKAYFVANMGDFEYPETAFQLAADAHNRATGAERLILPPGQEARARPRDDGATEEGADEQEPLEQQGSEMVELPPEGLPPFGAGDAGRKAAKHFETGLAYQEAGKRKQALRSFQRCLRAAEHPACHRQLGLLYQKEGRDKQAVRHLERYVELVPKAPDAATAARLARRLQSLR